MLRNNSHLIMLVLCLIKDCWMRFSFWKVKRWMFMLVLMSGVFSGSILIKQGLIIVLKDVKRGCICILIQKRDFSVYFLPVFLLKLRQVLKLSLKMPGPELILLQLEVENYAQNKGKIYFKNKLELEFSKFLCEVKNPEVFVPVMCS